MVPSPSGWTTRSRPTRSGCASASASRRRCSATRTCSSSTSRPTASIPPESARSASSSATSPPSAASRVFVSSHLLSEIEQTCDRVAIIHRGRTLARARCGSCWPARELGPRAHPGAPRRARGAEALAAFGPAEYGSGGAAPEAAEGVVTARVPAERVPEALRALAGGGIDVFTVERPLGDARRGLPRDHGRRDGMRFPGLVENEILKICQAAALSRRRADSRRAHRTDRLREGAAHAKSVTWKRTGASRRRSGWRNIQNWLRGGRMPASSQRWAKFELGRLQYHLDRDINPEAISGPLFARGFANAASYLLLPLLAIVFASDIVSARVPAGDDQAAADAARRPRARARLEARRPGARDHADRPLRRDRRLSLRRRRVRIRGMGRAGADGLPGRRETFDPSAVRVDRAVEGDDPRLRAGLVRDALRRARSLS